MVKEYLPGLMEGNMKGTIMMIKRRVLEYFIGQMGDNILVCGKMGSNMEEVLL